MLYNTGRDRKRRCVEIDEFDPDLITLTDEDNKEYRFEILDRIETDEGRYIALLPDYDDPQKMLDDSGELIILRAVDDDGDEVFEVIDDDEEFNAAYRAFETRLRDIYDIES